MIESESRVSLDYIAAGGNRHPSAAEWAPGLLAFGSGNNIALWNPESERQNGIYALLSGHSDHVNAVKIYERSGRNFLISGAADKTVRIWEPASSGYAPFEEKCCLTDHDGSINAISILPEHGIFVTGAADGTVNVWSLSDTEAKLVQTISLKPRYFPLTAAVISLSDEVVALAVAGTSSTVQLYIRSKADSDFVLQATLVGHEGWIRSLDFVQTNDDVLLASASQDKYIRLWRFRRGGGSPSELSSGNTDPTLARAKKGLSNKSHQVGSPALQYSVTFEALLIGHEDWIYTARWAPLTASDSSPTLLSASADNSLATWSADEASGVWVCNARLGEISAQKGSTTATGSTGGFWIGLWGADRQSVVSLGRTGSWRRWAYNSPSDRWQQRIGTSGHTQEVRGLSWAPDGSYLLTTSADQTTRLFAEWKREGLCSWHEIARPQIHGYDLNCLHTISANRFVSGADEKLLRVFNKPKAIDNLLSKLSGTEATVTSELADAANIPVLGLSNKAIAAAPDDEPVNGVVNGDADQRETVNPASVVRKSTLDLQHPPFEDQLARHTLWPEHEKLYGHGYEISAVAASHDGLLIATACKASSIDHAVIRLYETREWREVKPALTAHSLTVTSLAFSDNDKYLLSVSRDRQWSVFRREEEAPNTYHLLTSNPKGHTRMILDCAWAPAFVADVFATAARDKSVKIWRLSDNKAECVSSITVHASITAIAFSRALSNSAVSLALGTEEGQIEVGKLDCQTWQITDRLQLPQAYCPSQAVNALRWRPAGPSTTSETEQLAVVSDDQSVRILELCR